MGTLSYLPTGGPHRDAALQNDAAPDDSSGVAGASSAEADAETVAAEAARAEKVSMHALTRRGMSRWELGERLLSRDLDSSVVEAELDRLERVGLIDDAGLAETIVRTQHERKGLGRSALNSEMRRRKIDQGVIDDALAQLDGDDERARAGELAERRARQMSGLDRETAARRLNGYLMRKGYAFDVVREAVDAALPRAGSGSSVRFR